MAAKRKTLALLIGAGLIVGVSSWTLALPVGSAQTDPQGQLSGQELAEALELELHEAFPPPGGCDYFVTRDIDGSMSGWCLDEVVDSEYEGWELAHRLTDTPVTELDRQIFHLSTKYASMDAETREADEIMRQLDALIALQETASG